MSYYLRAFCTEPTVPELADVLSYAGAKGCPVQIDPEAAGSVEAAHWLAVQIPILYKQGKLPLLVEVDRKEDRQSPFEGEIAEFVEAVGEVDELGEGTLIQRLASILRTLHSAIDPLRRPKPTARVIRHLNATQFIVACQLPTSDIDDDGYDAAGWLMAYFRERCGGMIQADGEGFYEGNSLIVEL